MVKNAIKNLQRNRRRTILSATAIAMAVLISLIVEGWIGGTRIASINGTARQQTGHVRIISSQYQKRERFLPVDELIPDATRIINRIRKQPGVKSVEERIRFGIIMGKGSRSYPAVGMGIEFGSSTLGIRARLIKNHPDKPFNPDGLYPGKKLAEKLRATSGDALLVAARTSMGGLNGIKAVVGEPISTGSSAMDNNSFFISIKQARRLLKTGSNATEILVYLHDPDQAPQIAKSIKKFLPPGILALTLAEQNPVFYNYLDTISSMMFLINSFILFLASFVVINTMMMAIFERTREIGTLKALGMDDSEIVLSFTLEGGIIGAIGGLIGAALGWILLSVTASVGIDLSRILKSMDMPIEYIIYPTVSIGSIVVILILSVIIPALSSMVPALKIRRKTAAEALRQI